MHQILTRRIKLLGAALICAWSIQQSPRAAEAQTTFAGKTITIVYGAPAGGVLDLHAQLLARHLGAHILGSPTVIATAMPGAASKVLARHMISAARNDGTEIGEVFPAALLDPLLGNPPSGYDPRQLMYLGSSHYDAAACLLRKDAPAKSLTDLLSTQVTVAVSAPGSPTFDFPALLSGVLGAKLKLIRGYPGGNEMELALERGEVNAICGSWSQLRVRYPKILAGGLEFQVIVHGDDRPDSDLNLSNIPSAARVAKTDTERNALNFFVSQNALASAFILPPALSPERRDILRRAFEETLRDPELLADAKRMNLDISYLSGEQTKAIVQHLFEADPAVIALVKNSLQ